MRDPLIEWVHGRHNAMVDPHLHVWGWEIPVYLFLGGLVAGILILVPMLEFARGERPRSNAVRLVPFAAVLLLTLGMLALFLDLENKLHVYRFYLAFQPASPMSWGSWILLLVYPIALLLGIGSLSEGLREALIGWRPMTRLGLSGLLGRIFETTDTMRRPLLWASILVGVGLGVYTGILLGTMVSRPQWNTSLLPPLFLVSGFSTAAAFLTLFPLQDHEQHSLIRWDVFAILVEILLIGLMLIGFATGGRLAQHAFYHLVGGPWTAAFWSLVVVAGLMVPLMLELIEIRRRMVPTLITPILILVGGISLRFILVIAGQMSSFREFL